MAVWLNNIQLPVWLSNLAENAKVSVRIENGVVTDVVNSDDAILSSQDSVWQGNGRLAISGLSEMHTHLDKTYTRHRLGRIKPGLLSAIEAMEKDKQEWDLADLQIRMHQGLERAFLNGVTHMRTHIDWSGTTPPLAWQLFDDLSMQWRHNIHLERVALIPLPLFGDIHNSRTLAESIKQSDKAILGAFIHSSNYSESAMENLFTVATEFELDLDLHINEELQSADGLVWLADYLNREGGFQGSMTCGHACGLHVLSDEQVSGILTTFAKHNVTIVALPTTNLLLQDAVTGVTPTQRGITVVKEAVAHNVRVMFSSDNVADAFCPYGDYNPISVLKLACMASQLLIRNKVSEHYPEI